MNVAIYGPKITKENSVYFKEVLDTLAAFGWNPILEKNLKNQKKFGSFFLNFGFLVLNFL